MNLGNPPVLRAVDVLRLLESIIRDTGLTKAERVALADLVLHVSRKTNRTFPSQATITEETKVHPRDVCAAIRKGLGRYIRKVGQGKYGLVIYEVILPTGGTSKVEVPGTSIGTSKVEVPGTSKGTSRSTSIGTSTHVVMEPVEPFERGGKPGPHPTTPPEQTETTAAAETTEAGPASLPDDLVHRAAAVWGDRATPEDVAQNIAADLAVGAYTAADLAACIEAKMLPVWPSQLKTAVPAAAKARRQEAFEAQLLTIQAQRLVRATCPGENGDGARVAEVRNVDPGAGVLVLDELVGGFPAARIEDLERQVAEANPDFADTASGRAVRDRLVAVRAGRRDPRARDPEHKRFSIKTPAELARWRFEPEGVSP
jgi:hypothetical protein